MVRVSTKSLMGPKVKILMGQMANTLGSGPWAYVFAASAASAAKCFHTEVGAPRGLGPGPWAPLCGSILLPKLLKQQKHKQMHIKSLPLSATLLFSKGMKLHRAVSNCRWRDTLHAYETNP